MEDYEVFLEFCVVVEWCELFCLFEEELNECSGFGVFILCGRLLVCCLVFG